MPFPESYKDNDEPEKYDCPPLTEEEIAMKDEYLAKPIEGRQWIETLHPYNQPIAAHLTVGDQVMPTTLVAHMEKEDTSIEGIETENNPVCRYLLMAIRKKKAILIDVEDPSLVTVMSYPMNVLEVSSVVHGAKTEGKKNEEQIVTMHNEILALEKQVREQRSKIWGLQYEVKSLCYTLLIALAISGGCAVKNAWKNTNVPFAEQKIAEKK